MRNNYKIIIFTIIVAVVGVSVYYLISAKSSSTEENTSTLKEESLLGCYVAHLGKDIYTLNIQSSNSTEVSGILAYNNYQKDSSSGSFKGAFQNDILLGKYSFDSEGSRSERQVIFKKVGDSFVQGFGPVKVVGGEEFFDPISSVEYDSKSTFIKSNNCLEQFIDANGVISFDYNSFFKSIEWEVSPSTDWKIGAKEQGVLLATVIIPRTYMSNTNFSDAKLTVGRSTTANSIKSCTAINGTVGEIEDGISTIGGYPFSKFTGSDAGAGNFYETTSYRGIVDGDCYVVEYTIHSTNIENYSSEQNIKEFNKSVIQNELEKIIRSLKFEINSK